MISGIGFAKHLFSMWISLCCIFTESAAISLRAWEVLLNEGQEGYGRLHSCEWPEASMVISQFLAAPCTGAAYLFKMTSLTLPLLCAASLHVPTNSRKCHLKSSVPAVGNKDSAVVRKLFSVGNWSLGVTMTQKQQLHTATEH
jgi:hypothetical protein